MQIFVPRIVTYNSKIAANIQQSIIINHKLLIDGQIYILRGDKTYTLTGQEVR